MSCSFNLESVLNYITVLQWSTEEKKTLTYNLLNKIQNLSSTWVEAAETKGTAVKKHFQRLIPEIPQQLNIRIPNEGGSQRQRAQLLHLEPVERDCANIRASNTRNCRCIRLPAAVYPALTHVRITVRIEGINSSWLHSDGSNEDLMK